MISVAHISLHDPYTDPNPCHGYGFLWVWVWVSVFWPQVDPWWSLVGPDNSQLSLLSQIQGGAIFPRLVRNITKTDPNIHPMVLRRIINSMAETSWWRESQHTMEKLLLKEALSNLCQTCPAAWVVKTKHPFDKAPPGYKENWGEVIEWGLLCNYCAFM